LHFEYAVPVHGTYNLGKIMGRQKTIEVCQRGVPACKDIIDALLSGVLEAGKTYKIFVVDTLTSRLANSF